MHKMLFLSLLMLAECLVVNSLGAQDRGLQFIGFSRSTARDVQFVKNAFSQNGGDLQIGFLPFEFNPSDPFGNADELASHFLVDTPRTIEFAVFLKWFPHDRAGNASQRTFWDAWAANNPNNSQRAIKESYRHRVDQAILWASTVKTMARAFGIANRVKMTFIPVLEDICLRSQRTGFDKAVGMIRRKAQDAGFNLSIRRSCLREFYFRVPGVKMELHGTWDQVRGLLQRGDTWSNDGTNYSRSAFIRDQRRALSAGVNVLLWRQLYNGRQPRTRDNWAQRTVDPFTSANQRRFASRVLND